jgi:hypothetical protein
MMRGLERQPKTDLASRAWKSACMFEKRNVFSTGPVLLIGSRQAGTRPVFHHSVIQN